MLVKKPWGSYQVFLETEDYTVKELRIFPGERFSLQKHNHRSEEWTILEGDGLMTLGEDLNQTSTFVLVQKSRAIVPRGYIHRLRNMNKNKDLVVLEIWWGDSEKPLSEEDIVRYEDDFNRIN